jgi:thioredoxin
MAAKEQSAMMVVICPKCGAKNRVDESKAALLQPKCGKCGTVLDLTRTAPAASAGSAAHPQVVTDATFDRDVLGMKGRPVLVDFWAPWCGPCRMLTPTLEELAGQANGKYAIMKLNVDENPRTAARYNISGIPAMFIFKNGQKVDELIGLQPKKAIAAALAKVA